MFINLLQTGSRYDKIYAVICSWTNNHQQQPRNLRFIFRNFEADASEFLEKFEEIRFLQIHFLTLSRRITWYCVVEDCNMLNIPLHVLQCSSRFSSNSEANASE